MLSEKLSLTGDHTQIFGLISEGLSTHSFCTALNCSSLETNIGKLGVASSVDAIILVY